VTETPRESNGKAVEEKRAKGKKPPGYREFEKLLKQVVNAPPMPKKVKEAG